MAAGAVALSVGVAPPPENNTMQLDVALMASGPNYKKLITDASNSLDELLLTGTLTDALNALLNPLGGNLTSTAEQINLLAVDGVVNALIGVLNRWNSLPDVSDVPGLPPGAGDALDQNLGPVFDAIAGLLPLDDILDNLTGVHVSLDVALDNLEAVNDLLTSLLGVPPISTVLALAGISLPQIALPSIPGLVDDLLEDLGATATATVYDSILSWPVLGVAGSSNVTNVFAQIPSLTVGSLVDAVLAGVVIPNLNSLIGPILSAAGLSIPAELSNLPGLVDAALSPLNLIATPPVTVWSPSANGFYTLPMGGSVGYLATMPTVDIGPLTVGDTTFPQNGAETVVATPIFAAGTTLPLNLASVGVLTTPGILFPTATGVSALNGTTLQSLAVPGLINVTNLNTLSAFYVGTNGININTGRNSGTLVTPFGTVPYEFSLGSFNVGTTGFGYSGASIAGVDVLPGFQIGTAPVQISDDGLIPAELINAGLTPVETGGATTAAAGNPLNAHAEGFVEGPRIAVLSEPAGDAPETGTLDTGGDMAATDSDVVDASGTSRKERQRPDLTSRNAPYAADEASGTAKYSKPPRDASRHVREESEGAAGDRTGVQKSRDGERSSSVEKNDEGQGPEQDREDS